MNDSRSRERRHVIVTAVERNSQTRRISMNLRKMKFISEVNIQYIPIICDGIQKKENLSPGIKIRSNQ